MSNARHEITYPLAVKPYVFVGKKPVAMLFGEERVDVKTWRQVYTAILRRCNDDPVHHERLMYLRNKVAGKVRKFLSDIPNGMSSPLKIDEDMYGETHYGSETLMHILVNHILAPAHFDYSNISIVIKLRFD